jgi:hypothetical protein
VKGLPLIEVKVPLIGSTLNAETLFEASFATYAKPPVGSNAIAMAFVPAANGLPLTGVSAPVVGLIEKAETLLLKFAV